MVYFGFGLLGMALASAVYYRRRNMENIYAVKVEQQEISKKLSSDKDVFALDEQLIHADNFTFLTTIRKKMISAFQLYTEQMNVSCHLSDYRGVKEEYLSQKFYDLPHTNDIYEHIDRLNFSDARKGNIATV